MEIEGSFTCVYCFEINDTLVDGSGGKHQEYVEDCQVCCRPNYLTIEIDENLNTAAIASKIP
jgi:hypothetical protein